MSCSPFDLRDYFLKELPDPETRQVEAHVKSCEACREELERLRLTEASLLTLRDEEIPQRIAFVSDKIFEPSPARRWWSAFWNSSARLGFASAAILGGVMLFHPITINRPVIAQAVPPAPAPAARTISETEIQSRIDAAVRNAVADSEARQEVKLKQALDAEFKTARGRYLLNASDTFARRREEMARARAFDFPHTSGEPK